CEPARHLGGGFLQQVGVGLQAGAPQREAFGCLGLRRRGQIGQQRLRIFLLRIDERVEEVGGLLLARVGHASSSTLLIAVPACTRTRSPAATGSTSAVTTSSTPRAVRTLATPSAGAVTSSPSRPSSLQVTHTSSVQSESLSSPECSKHTCVSSHSRW